MQGGAPGLRGSKISNLHPSCPKIMLMILTSGNNLENDLCALNALKCIIFIPQFTTNDFGKSSD